MKNCNLKDNYYEEIKPFVGEDYFDWKKRIPKEKIQITTIEEINRKRDRLNAIKSKAVDMVKNKEGVYIIK